MRRVIFCLWSDQAIDARPPSFNVRLSISERVWVEFSVIELSFSRPVHVAFSVAQADICRSVLCKRFEPMVTQSSVFRSSISVMPSSESSF